LAFRVHLNGFSDVVTGGGRDVQSLPGALAHVAAVGKQDMVLGFGNNGHPAIDLDRIDTLARHFTTSGCVG